ncbi:MAG: heavy-metal-associated domain-containing protein [Thermomicrobiales bacterium]
MSGRKAPRIALGLLIVVTGLVVAPDLGFAQDATAPADDHIVAHHPAHVHRGSCAEPDPAPAFVLTELAMDLEAMGQGPAIPVEFGVTTVEATLSDLLASPHAIDIHEIRESPAEQDMVVACGDIGGQPAGDELAVGVREQNGSGFAGIAWLQPSADGTAITLFMAHGLAGETHATADTQATEATATFHVPTITCPACHLRVEASISNMPGILEIAFDGQDVTVTYDPSQVSPEEIEAAIESGGDEAERVGA